MEGGEATRGVIWSDSTITPEKLLEAIEEVQKLMDDYGPMGEIRSSPWVPDDGFYLLDSGRLTLMGSPRDERQPQYMLIARPAMLAKAGLQPGIQRFPKSLIEQFNSRREKANGSDGEGAPPAGDRQLHGP